jgi:PKD repeat protein
MLAQSALPHAFDTPSPGRTAGGLLVALAATCGLLLLGGPARAAAAEGEVSCPNANPIVNENNCMGEGTEANRLSDYSETLGGFTTQTSYDRGENVQLKIGTSAPSFPATSVNIAVYRIGWYGGKGARLISAAGATKVKVNNSLTCNPMNKETGELSCSNWNVTYTIPGSSLPVSGIYEAVFTDLADGGVQNMVTFTVREERASDVLFVLPISTYEAYNTWGCKSLYFDACGLGNTISGEERAVKVSFERPLAEGEEERNKFFGPDYHMVQWLEEQGYNVTYTDDVQLASNPESLLDHKVDLISGHSEYWSYAAFHNMIAAREHGVSIASFSSNTAYWQTRFENNYRTLVCYKTVQGGEDGPSPNDPASIGPHGEFLPQLATTTRRDPGAPAGTPGAPPEGRVGPDEPENELFGVLYVGDNESEDWGLAVPSTNANGEYEGSRVWRNAGIPSNSEVIIDKDIVGWEWDQIPSAESPLYAHAAEVEPEGVKRLSLTKTLSPNSTWLQDYGRERAATPPPGQSDEVSAAEYRAKSGAYVFASGTMQWSFGLDVDNSINQATYNILAEMGAQPGTPESSLVLEAPGAPKPPWPQFTATPKKALVGEPVEFNASATTDSDATVTHYYWDFEGNGFTVETGAEPTVPHTFTEPGVYNVILKVIDSDGQEETTSRTVTVVSSITPVLAASPNPASTGQKVTFDASGSTDVKGPITDYRWDLNGSGKFETDTGSTPTVTTTFASAGEHTVSVRESDAAGNTATTTLTERIVTIGVSNYEEAVLATPGLLHFYPLGEAGPPVADLEGGPPADLDDVTYGAPGAINGDPAASVNFGGADDPQEGDLGSSGEIPLNLSSQKAITVEFWMKWNDYGNGDNLAMELTSNYNNNAGGFIVDPNAEQFGGTFAVGIGDGEARNSIYIQRPSAGVWHHYAFVLDTTAPAEHEITPYVDGRQVSFQQEGKGTGGGPFANSTLYLFSRDASSLYGSGYLQDLAIYSGDLSAAAVEEHFDDNGTDPRPKASFTATPNPVRPGQTVTFNASGSSYSKGAIVKYEWDLKGTGKYETTTTTPTVTTSYSSEQTVNVGLRVTDSNGGWSYTTQEVKVGSFPPVAHVSVSPSAPLTGQKVTLNASGSTDQGTITDYRWDLEGRGTYETNTGTTPTVSTYFDTAGVHDVGLELTDSEGLTSKTTIPVKVLEQGPSGYTPTVLSTPGLIHYYKLAEAAGPTIFDSVGTSDGAISGGTFGLPGAVQGDPSTAIGFNGSSDYGAIPLNLSGTSQLTVEFWLKWNGYANNDSLAMEFTPNFNEHEGGFIVDPDAPQFGGTFGVALGSSEDRYSAFFERPSAGVWHHYVLVLNSAAPAGGEITPYVDGQPVSYQIGSDGSGAGAFANSTLYLMSRDGSSLFGAGDLQDLAIYNQPLSAGTAFQHFSSEGTAEPPHPAFTATPNPVRAGENVTLDASGSTDPDAKIVDYQWALSGNGHYETDSGSDPTTTTSFATPGTYEVSLRVTDANGASESVTHKIEVGNFPPVVKLTANPSPALTGQTVTLSAAGSTDQGTITGYRWDLEGRGTYETSTGTTPTIATSFATVGAHTVGVEVTDDHGLSTRTTIAVPVLEHSVSSYPSAVEGTPGLTDFYKLGESSGPTIRDSVGSSNGTISGGTFGVPGAVQGDSGTAIGFNGTSDSGAIPLNLSGTSQLTVEFWLKWSSYADNDSLAMEFTPNFNENSGGFLVDPNASQFGGTFGVAIGTSGTRNAIYFPRPSAGVWHHYAFVLNSAAPASSEITPYVDGVPVSDQQEGAETAQGPFANSTLYLMSRDGSSLFGAGALQYLAIYDQPLSAATIFQHYNSDGATGESPPPPPPDTTPPTGGALTVNGTAASGSGTTSYNTSGGFTIGTRTEYVEAPSQTESGLASSTLTVASAPLASDVCGTFGAPTTLAGTPAQTEPTGCYRYTLTGVDDAGNSASVSTTVIVDTTPPTTPTLSFSGLSHNAFYSSAQGTLYFSPSGPGEFAVTAASSDPDTGVAGYTFGSLAANGFTQTQTGAQDVYAFGTTSTAPVTSPTVLATDNAGATSSASFKLVADTTPPTGGALKVNATSATAEGSLSYSKTGSFGIGTRTEYAEAQSATQSGLASSTLTVASATVANDVCGTFGAPTTLAGTPAQTEPTGCYRYTLTGVDDAGNSASVSTTVIVDTTPPTTPTLSFSGLSHNAYYGSAFNTVYFNPSSTGEFAVTAASSDPYSGVAGYTFGSLVANGFTQTQTGAQDLDAFGTTATAPTTAATATATSNAGVKSASAGFKLAVDTTAPTGGALTVNATAATAAGSASYNRSGSFTIGTRTNYTETQSATQSGLASSTLTVASAPYVKNACGTFGTPTTLTGSPSQSGLAEGCYRYTLTGVDNVGNSASVATTVEVDFTPPVPTVSVPADANGTVAVTFGATDSGAGVNAATGQLKRAIATYTPATESCGVFAAFANLGPVGPSSPYSDTTVSTGHCYEYEYTVSDLAGNSATSAVSKVKVSTTGPTLTSIVDNTPGATGGLPQVGDVLVLHFSDPIAAASIPTSVTIAYRREATGSTTIAVAGIGSGSWSTGDAEGGHYYSKVGGTAATVTATTTVATTAVKLTVTKVTDPSGNLTAGGPGVVSGSLSSSVTDVFGNQALTSQFGSASIKLF